MRWSATPPQSSRRPAARCWARCAIPFPGQDFSSFLLQAQQSKAKIIGLANAGADTTNAIKQAAEFGIVQGGQNLAGLLVFITDVHALGLKTAQGLILTEAWYWDQQRQQPRLRQGVRARPTRATCRPWCRPASIRPSRTT